MRGTYVLLIRLERERTAEIGKLGVFTFPAGWYAYTGSAMGSLEKRIARHLALEKKKRWHIDYFLEIGRVVGVIPFPGERKIECSVNKAILEFNKARVIAKGFGSSDCKCPSHLLYLG